MKNLGLILLLGCFYFSCAPKVSENASKFARADKEIRLTDNEIIPQSNLETYLSRAGLYVTGIGSNAHVGMPGYSPLFVVNGNEIGDSYSVTLDIVRDKKIKSLRYLKEIHELGAYGWRGKCGVVLIKTN